MQFKSQGGQDKWVCDMLNNKRKGYFIDIGACDGISLSNTYYLEKELGWEGICVEPAKMQFKNLKKLRKCTCVNNAVFNKDGTVRFMEYKNDKYRGNITDVKFNDTGFQYEIESITFESLIKKCRCPDVIDYISLDVEGLEYEILAGFPFDKYISLLWTIEFNTEREKIRELMLSNGYVLANSIEWEDWYLHG